MAAEAKVKRLELVALEHAELQARIAPQVRTVTRKP